MNLLWLFLGLGFLVAGAEILVRGAVALSQLAKISSLVVGLTVVAFGTSAPELSVSIMASINDNAAMAVGNVIGSNVFNVLFILGTCACILPIAVQTQLVRFDIPIMIAGSVATYLIAFDGMITRVDGIVMFAMFIVYTAWLIGAGRRSFNSSTAQAMPPNKTETDEVETGQPVAVEIRANGSLLSKLWINGFLIVIGLCLLIVGGNWLVNSATLIAQAYQVSDLVIGLTIVAAGTSLPELATSVAAAIKGQRDIAVGSVVGSNIFNLLTVLSLAAITSRSGVPVSDGVLRFDLLVLVGAALVCWPICFSQLKITRKEGLVMLSLYLLYVLATLYL